MGIDLLKRRRELLNGFVGEKPIVLPEGYELGSYLNITGSTKATGFSNMPFDIEIKIAPSAFNGRLFGTTSSFCLTLNSDGRAACEYTSTTGTSVSNDVMFHVGTDSVVKSHQDKTTGKSTYFVDDVDTGLKGTTGKYGGNFFANNDYGSKQYKGKVYYIKVYKDNKLFAHFVPIKSSTTSTMYDIVRKVFMSFSVKNATVVI